VTATGSILQFTVQLQNMNQLKCIKGLLLNYVEKITLISKEFHGTIRFLKLDVTPSK